MNERVSIQEIAAILVEKHSLRKKEAETFVLTMFDLVKEALTTDRLVKIKGLGTLKVVDIEARESVNVNTGERVVIEGHGKITFTPDTTMKELVNKPFSQFETVVLNEGVTFDDMPESAEGVENEETEAAVVEPEPVVVPEPVVEPEPVVDPEPEVEPEPEPEVEPESEKEPEEKPEEEEYMSKKMTYISLVVAIVACILSFAGGYYYRGTIAADAVAPEEPKVEQTVIADSVDQAAKDTTATAVKDTTVTPAEPVAQEPAQPAETQAEPAKPAETKAEPKQEPAKPAEPKTEPAVQSDKYDKMDARVRTGAYRIVGTDHQEKVRAGETVARIARRTLGPDMECYIEVYNGLTAASQLKEGQVINIPKLELKKKKKQNK